MPPQDEKTLHGIFAAGAAESPDRICLKIAGQKGRTYAEVLKAVRRVASHVAAMPGHTVAIAAERSCEMIFSLLGIMMAGKAYCPIYPETTLKCMLAMSKAAQLHCVLVPAFQEPLIVYRLNWKVYYVGIMGTVTCCDRAEPDGKDGSLRGYAMAATAPLPATDSDSSAYVLFTAGSTGQLAGKTYTHKESVNFVLPVAKRLNCPRGQRFLFMTPYAAQTSVLEIFTSFAESGTLVIAPNEQDQADSRARFLSGAGAVDNSPGTSPAAGRERFTSAREDRGVRESTVDGLAAPAITDLFNRELVDVCFLAPPVLQRIVDYVDVAPKMGTVQGASHLLHDDLGWLAFAETSSPSRLATLKRVVAFGAVDEATRASPIFAGAEVLSVPDVQLGAPLAGARLDGNGLSRSKSDGNVAGEVDEEEAEIEPEIVQRVDLIMDGSMPIVPQTKQVKAMRAGNLRWRVGNAHGLKGQLSKATVI
jgi:acyl-CoA synthetase (AMP-forming)/AMP-acid ligase II